jgi:hypothetical protein
MRYIWQPYYFQSSEYNTAKGKKNEKKDKIYNISISLLQDLVTLHYRKIKKKVKTLFSKIKFHIFHFFEEDIMFSKYWKSCPRFNLIQLFEQNVTSFIFRYAIN